ncbi:MAG: MATE family efflux transporter [Pseudomonadota bacterium]
MALGQLTSDIRALLVLGLPLVGSQLAQASIQIVDTLMLGRYDVEVLAGVVLANALFFSTFIVGSGFAWAVTPLVAAAVTKGDLVRVRRVTRMGGWASLGFAALVIPVMLSGEALFLALGQAPEQAAIAREYLSVAAWGMAPALGVMVLRSHLTAVEHTRIVLWVTLAATLLNAFLNWVFIFGNLGAPEMGARGAALASLALHIASLGALVLYIQRWFPDQALFVRLWRPDWEELGQVLKLGWPIGVALLAETGLFSAAAIMVGWVGAVELAAHGIALQLATMTFMIHMGLSHAATVRAGTAYARGDWAGLRRGGQAALIVSLSVALVSACGLVALAEPLVSLFLDPNDPSRAMIIAIGAGLVVAAAIFQMADGAQVTMISLLRGLQDTRRPMILAAFSYWIIGAPLAYVIGILWGGGAFGVWMGLVAGLTCASGLLFHRFWRVMVPRLDAASGELNASGQ